MSSYSKLKGYAVGAIGNLIPLDEGSCREIVDYSLTLPTDFDIHSHFLNLLGESTQTDTFIRSFLALKEKEQQEDQKKASKSQVSPHQLDISTNLTSAAWLSTPTSNPPQKSASKTKASAKTTSQLLQTSVKPTDKLSKKHDDSSQKLKRSNVKTLDNLRDIEQVLAELELSDKATSENRKCHCMAARHGLFELAPNCLNCGKIICNKEGLQPCSFCGASLLTVNERNDISKILLQEKEQLTEKKEKLAKASGKPKKPNSAPATKSKKTITVKMRPGETFWAAQDRVLKEIEENHKREAAEKERQDNETQEIKEQVEELEKYERFQMTDQDLVEANSRLETLLNFQETGAERTKIIDNAADFELPNAGASLWLSPMERALQLKKQHRQLRKHEEAMSERAGRGAKSIEMVIKDGKVVMVEKHHLASSNDIDEEAQDIKAIEQELKSQKSETDQALGQQFWDYEQDQTKWERPVYIPKERQPDSEGLQQPQLSNRVQFVFDAEENDLLV